MNKLRRGGGTPLDDDSALMLMARHILGGPTDEGRASYQIALSVCPECCKGAQQASGELVAVSDDAVAMAHCDGQYLELLAAPTANGNADTSETAQGRESVHAGAAAKAGANRRPAGAHTGARARQTIPPATRRAVLRRDHQCCVVPGCRNALFLDLHHIDLSSENGSNEADNLITLCAAHHRAAHRGELTITGRVSTGIHFGHADGSSYGQAPEPQRVEIQTKTFSALRGLGFREGEIRNVLTQLSRTEDARNTSTEHLLRAALAKLTSAREKA